MHSPHGYGIIYRTRIGRPPDKPISTIGFLVRPLVRRGVLAMNKDARPERRLGPNWPKSDFDKLCAEHGGPADLGITVEKNIFRGCCGKFPLARVLPILLQFATDETTARRHWPWAAFAIDQYHFEIKERDKYKDELKPKEIHELIKEIQRDAHDLRSALTRLQTSRFACTSTAAAPFSPSPIMAR